MIQTEAPQPMTSTQKNDPVITQPFSSYFNQYKQWGSNTRYLIKFVTDVNLFSGDLRLFGSKTSGLSGWWRGKSSLLLWGRFSLPGFNSWWMKQVMFPVSCRLLLTWTLLLQTQVLGRRGASGRLRSGPPPTLEDCLVPHRINLVCHYLCVCALFGCSVLV